MRLREVQYYPPRGLPTKVSDPVDLNQLNALRLNADQNGTTCPYRLVGNDDLVDQWIVFGHANGLLDVEWEGQLIQLAQMPRGDATRKLFANDKV